MLHGPEANILLLNPRFMKLFSNSISLLVENADSSESEGVDRDRSHKNSFVTTTIAKKDEWLEYRTLDPAIVT